MAVPPFSANLSPAPCTRCIVYPAPQAISLIFEGRVGEARFPARLAMVELGHLILRRGNHSLGICGQDILWTLIVKETVQTCEPECQPPSILWSPKILRIFAISLRGR